MEWGENAEWGGGAGGRGAAGAGAGGWARQAGTEHAACAANCRLTLNSCLMQPTPESYVQ